KESSQCRAFGTRTLTRCRKLGGDVSIENLFTCLIEFVHRASLAKPGREFAGRIGGRLSLRQNADELAGSDGAVISATGACRNSQRLQRGSQLGLLKSRASNFGAPRQRGEGENVRHDPAFDLDLG